MTAKAKAARCARLSAAIDRLAALIEDGELLAAADPAALLHAAADTIERRGPDWRATAPTEAERAAHGTWLMRWGNGRAVGVEWSPHGWIYAATGRAVTGYLSAVWCPCGLDLQAVPWPEVTT